MSTTEALQIKQILPGVNGHAVFNEAMLLLTTVLARGVNSAGEVTLPTAPVDGDAHIVSSAPTAGDPLENFANYIIIFYNNKWYYIEPITGTRIWVRDTFCMAHFESTTWVFGVSGSAVIQARKSGGNQDSTSATFTAIDLQTRLIENADAFTHPVSGDQGRFEVLAAGSYEISLSCQVESVTNSCESEFAIGINSETTATDGSQRRCSLTAAGQYQSVHTSIVVQLAAGDDIYPIFRRVSGTGTVRIADERATFMIRCLSPN